MRRRFALFAGDANDADRLAPQYGALLLWTDSLEFDNGVQSYRIVRPFCTSERGDRFLSPALHLPPFLDRQRPFSYVRTFIPPSLSFVLAPDPFCTKQCGADMHVGEPAFQPACPRAERSWSGDRLAGAGPKRLNERLRLLSKSLGQSTRTSIPGPAGSSGSNTAGTHTRTQNDPSSASPICSGPFPAIASHPLPGADVRLLHSASSFGQNPLPELHHPPAVPGPARLGSGAWGACR